MEEGRMSAGGLLSIGLGEDSVYTDDYGGI